MKLTSRALAEKLGRLRFAPASLPSGPELAMKVSPYVLAAGLLLETPVSSHQSVDIGRWEEGAGERDALRFKASDVVLIEVKTGQRAVVQFTPVSDTHARYRWRYRRSADSRRGHWHRRG